MTPTQEALLIGAGAVAVALLAVAGIIPEAIAQYAPLVAVPYIVRNSRNCRGRLSERRS